MIKTVCSAINTIKVIPTVPVSPFLRGLSDTLIISKFSHTHCFASHKTRTPNLRETSRDTKVCFFCTRTAFAIGTRRQEPKLPHTHCFALGTSRNAQVFPHALHRSLDIEKRKNSSTGIAFLSYTRFSLSFPTRIAFRSDT